MTDTCLVAKLLPFPCPALPLYPTTRPLPLVNEEMEDLAGLYFSVSLLPRVIQFNEICGRG